MTTRPTTEALVAAAQKMADDLKAKGWTKKDFGVAMKAMFDAPPDDPTYPMSLEPMQIADPIDRARLIFTQWHVDEAVDGVEASVYAERLLDRLGEYGLTVIPNTDRTCKTCDWWQDGCCNAVGRVLEPAVNSLEINVTIQDPEGLSARLRTGPDFGCTHHVLK